MFVEITLLQIFNILKCLMELKQHPFLPELKNLKERNPDLRLYLRYS